MMKSYSITNAAAFALATAAGFAMGCSEDSADSDGGACTPDCASKTCGDDDGCGGACTACEDGFFCNATTWQCESVDSCPGLAANADGDCDACRSAFCCAEARACAADEACAAWLACEDACAADDIACQNACWSENPAGHPKADYTACKQRACAGICGPEECSEDYGYFDAEDDACRACRNGHCCTEEVAAWTNADSVYALECFATSPVTVCNDAEHMPYIASLAAHWACWNRYCLEACGEEADCTVVYPYTGSCATCVHDSCCAEVKACSDDADCIEYAFCQWTSTTAGGLMECEQKHWVGGGRHLVQDYCLKSSCVTECGGPTETCGGLPYVDSGSPDPECESCMEGACCAEAEACGTDAACAGLFVCMTTCDGVEACRDACFANSLPAAVTAFQAVESCRTANCASDCSAF